MSDAVYTIESLRLSAFRAYLAPKTFTFNSKRSLAVFAPNGSGKSSIIDALEFMFSRDGSLDRLGLRTIDNNAGIAALAHNHAEEKGLDPHVHISFKRGRERMEGTRSASGATRPRPDVATRVQQCFVVDPIIRGHELRDFVGRRTASQRYEDVARWLQLDPYVVVQRHLRSLRQSVKSAASDQTALERVDDQLRIKTADEVRSWNEPDVLAFANATLGRLDDKLTMNSLGRSDGAFIEVENRAKAEEQQLGIEGLRQIRRAAADLYEEIEGGVHSEARERGQLVEFAKSVAAHASARTVEAKERQTAANSLFAELWRHAEPLFEEGSWISEECPICLTPIAASGAGSVDGVRSHIAARRTELADYAKAASALGVAASAADGAYSRLRTMISTLTTLLTDAHEELRTLMSTYVSAAESWAGEGAPDTEPLKASLKTLSITLDEDVAAILARQGNSTYVRVLRRLDELVTLADEREYAERMVAQFASLASALNEQAEFITRALRTEVQALVDTLQEPTNAIYRHIQGSEASRIRLELPDGADINQQRLNLVIDFADNRKGVQPVGYLSDSQIHSLALALRLAAIKEFNTAAPIVALDDIVTSYDADHRRSIAGLLATDFRDCQLIITTHDERFFIYLKDQLGDGSCQFSRIVRLERDFGPRFVDHRVSDAMIESRWQEGLSAANEMRQCEEEWLLGLCRDFGVDIRIRSVDRAYSFERAELASALAVFLKKLGLAPPLVPGVNNRFLDSIQQGAVENFGSHFQDVPYGDGSIGDERVRWDEFKYFRQQFVCPQCKKGRFKRPTGISRPVCSGTGCESQFGFVAPAPSES